MANHRAKRVRSSQLTPGAAPANSAGARPPLSRRKLWLFRLAAALGGPLLFVGLLELALRLTGYGYPTAFLLPARHQGQDVFVQNNQFGWRFFGPRMARLPEPFAISRNKSSEVVRILFFGESAAKGEPQPAFGPARMLQAILSQRHPGIRFEVVNVAMTAINSHAILDIARDCRRANADIWVIYMGNNEIVGPFGAGTVFGQQTPPRWLIRTTLALQATRIGQLLEPLSGRTHRPATGEEWGGMKMFLEQQVRADDPRMASVYRHFQHNLDAIIRAGQRNGAGVVVGTVAVNLRECAPFASVHRTGLGEAEQAQWQKAYESGVSAQAAGRLEAAAQHFKAAARIDDSHAELRFRQASCALGLGEVESARKHFQAACDLDTLRFRCDSRINELTRLTAGNRAAERVLLADVEREFAQRSEYALPGSDLFYEHVHPTFKGNFLLASTLAREVEKLMPANVVMNADPPWPSEEDCARRLGWSDWSRLAALQDILARVKAPPFIGQVNHQQQLEAFAQQRETLTAAVQAAGLATAREAVATALAANADAVLYGLESSLQQLTGDIAGAVASARRAVELLPTNPQTWLQLGLLLVRQQKTAEAAVAFAQATHLDPADVLARQNLAQALRSLGRHEEAIAQYQRAVKLQPNFSVAWISLGQLLEERGRKAEADECYRRALAGRSTRVTDLAARARFCRSRGWENAAATNYNAAIQVSPEDVSLRLESGQHLLLLNRNGEALEHFGEAVRLNPKSAQARHLYGSMLGQQGRPGEAEQEFREVLRLAPQHLEAKLNLGIALIAQRRPTEALAYLEEVLRLDPSNALAWRYVQELRAGEGAKN